VKNINTARGLDICYRTHLHSPSLAFRNDPAPSEFPEVVMIRRKWHSLFRQNQHMPASQARSAVDGIDTRKLDNHPAFVGPDILDLDGLRSLSRILQEHLRESLEA
jgi:hypothetical protein